MTQLKLYNTLTRQKEPFIPLDEKNVGLYVCGVTPYDDSHIGHARAYVVFDVLYRLLRHLYGENHVTYVRNFTDIDDKIIQRAKELGQTPEQVAERNIQSFKEDMKALNVFELPEENEPRVSTHMPQIVKMVDELLQAGYAYVTPSGDVMYRSRKFPRFGELARRKLDEQRHGERVAEDAEKESPNDFVLWKANAKSATKMEQAFNPKTLGAQHFSAEGRPGWHIECSVMSREHLGPTFDIHGGGEDLQFPHHCCEIAQSEALLPAGQPMARYWLHNGFITVNGTKMSKSLGNFTTIKDALQKYSPEAIRLWLLQTHYRKPVDYSDEALQAAEARLKKYRKLAYMFRGSFSEERAEELSELENASFYTPNIDNWNEEFLETLADDLNTTKALAIIDQEEDALKKLNMLAILGINLFKITSILERMDMSAVAADLYEQRAKARLNKNWQESDRLRDILKTEHGILVEDTTNGQTWKRM